MIRVIKPYVIETDQLLLRRFKPEDEPALCQLFTDPEVMQYSMGVKSSAEVRQWLDERLVDHRPCTFAVTLPSNGDVIGYCGVTGTMVVDGDPWPEIGYRLKRDHWGHGYATESAAIVRDFAFSELDKTRLVAVIDPANLASIRVAQKIGMCFWRKIMKPGYDHPDHLYLVQRTCE